MTNANLDQNVIYGLYCICHDEGVRYVGQTSQGVKNRLTGHRSTVRYRENRGLRMSHQQNWMLNHGLDNISATVLEVCSSPSELGLCEEKWISKLNGLTNLMPGGPQSRGYKLPHVDRSGSRNPMYGVKRPDVSELNRVLKTGTTWTDEARKAKSDQMKSWIAENGHPMKGRTHSLDSREKMSELRTGKKTGKDNPMYGVRLSDEEKQALSMSRSSFTEEDIRDIRTLKVQGLLDRQIAEKYGVHQSQINKIVNRKRYGWVV